MPLCRLPGPEFAAWEDALEQLPKYAVAAGRGELRARLRALPPFPTDALLAPGGGSDEERWRAYLLLSFLAHGFMWCDGPDTPTVLPAGLAGPWCAVAAALDMPPVLVYATYNLYNWRRLDPAQVSAGCLGCTSGCPGTRLCIRHRLPSD